MRVDVYWNLHRGGYSIRAHGGKVLAHADDVSLRNVTMTVQHGARRKIAAGAAKTVHAFLVGDLVDDSLQSDRFRPITYNPRRDETFVYRDTHAPVLVATSARCTIVNGRAHVLVGD